jgi:drug/metabolite transporter (DMT)-like permease
LDWTDRILVTIGISQVSSSLPLILRGLIPPIAGFTTAFMFDRSFSLEKNAAVLITVTGILLGALGTIIFSSEDDDKSTPLGITLLLISTFTNAIQHCFEELTFRRDPKIQVVDMAACCSFWKAILVLGTIPIFNRIPVSTTVCSSGVLENNSDAFFELVQSSTL